MIVNSLVIYSGCRVPLHIPNYRPNAYIYTDGEFGLSIGEAEVSPTPPIYY